LPADRILRSRSAICQVRTHLFEELNSQLMDRRAKLNDCAPLRLVLRARLFEEADWTELRSGLVAGEVSLDDVRAAVESEAETGFGVRRQSGSRNT
jgi:hypothetical protein